MRKFLIGGLVLALTLGLASVASAKTTFTQDGHDQGLDLAIAGGGNQLTARSGPLAVEGEDYLEPENMPSKAGRVRLIFDEGIKLNAKKFPACSQADFAAMQGTNTTDAKAQCPAAQVSIDGPAFSEATAALNFGTGMLVRHPVVTAFNGPTKPNGNSTIILHAFISVPANTTLLQGELVPLPGGKTMLDVDKIPPLAGGFGALTDFFATLKATTGDAAAIAAAQQAVKKAKKAVKKAKKALKKAKSKSAKKKAKKKLKKAQKKLKKANQQLTAAKAIRIPFIDATCTGGFYETQGIWTMGHYSDPSDLNSFVTEFVIGGDPLSPAIDKVVCAPNNNTAPFDPGPGRG